MARQHQPQNIDDCTTCTLPERSGGLYHACMNCRNVAVKELEKIKNELEFSKQKNK